jgi:hypothetical protein
MQTSVKPKTTDDRRDFVVVPSDQVQINPSEDELTGLLRAAARHHSDQGAHAAPGAPGLQAPVPMVDTTFRATAVNDGVRLRSPFGRQLMRAVAALLLAVGIGSAAVGWQVFGYAAKKAVGRWLPQMALTSSLSLDKFGLASESKPSESTSSDDQPAATPAQADATPAQTAAATPVQNATDNAAPENAAAITAAPSSETAQRLQSMAHDLANANQEIETLKASITELKASQQQMARELVKATEQGAKTRAATQHAAAAVRKPVSSYSPTTAAVAPAYRPAPSSYSAQAATPSAAPQATAQPYAPPMQLQPQADPGVSSVPRPPMSVQ